MTAPLKCRSLFLFLFVLVLFNTFQDVSALVVKCQITKSCLGLHQTGLGESTLNLVFVIFLSLQQRQTVPRKTLAYPNSRHLKLVYMYILGRFQNHKLRNPGAYIIYVLVSDTLATKQMHTEAWFNKKITRPFSFYNQTNLIQLFLQQRMSNITLVH